MKKKILLMFILTILVSCIDSSKTKNKNEKNNDCLIGHDWCLPNCETPDVVFKFSGDGTFSFSTTLLGGNTAWGTWNDLGNQKIELKYTENTAKRTIPDRIISMPDCRTIKIGNTLYKR